MQISLIKDNNDERVNPCGTPAFSSYLRQRIDFYYTDKMLAISVDFLYYHSQSNDFVTSKNAQSMLFNLLLIYINWLVVLSP